MLAEGGGGFAKLRQGVDLGGSPSSRSVFLTDDFDESVAGEAAEVVVDRHHVEASIFLGEPEELGDSRCGVEADCAASAECSEDSFAVGPVSRTTDDGGSGVEFASHDNL